MGVAYLDYGHISHTRVDAKFSWSYIDRLKLVDEVLVLELNRPDLLIKLKNDLLHECYGVLTAGHFGRTILKSM